MKIKSFSLNNFIDENKKIEFISDYNIIYSEKNSTGKTTFVRAILYALGFSIPNTQKIRFSDFEFTLEVEVKSKLKIIKRKGSFIHINNIEYVLPVEVDNVMSDIFEIENIELLKNLLGCFYMDQEKGWTLLNRGVVIGDIRFYIEDFVRGLNDKDNLLEKLELSKINSEITKYKKMKDISEYQKQLNIASGNITYDSYDEDLQKRKQILALEKVKLKNKINDLENSINDNRKFINFIERMNLYIIIDKNNKIRVTKNNIDGLTDIAEIAESELRFLKLEYRKLLNLEAELNNEGNKNNAFVNVKTILDEFNEYIAKIPLNSSNIESVLKNLNKRKCELHKLINENTKQNNEWISFLYNKILEYSNLLGIDEYIENKDNYIFTNELKGYSGAVLHKLVFIFKLAYLKAITTKTGIKFPIIIDSPSGREVEYSTIQKMLDLLEREFPEHQVFISTIFKYQYKRTTKVILMDGTLFNIKGLLN